MPGDNIENAMQQPHSSGIFSKVTLIVFVGYVAALFWSSLWQVIQREHLVFLFILVLFLVFEITIDKSIKVKISELLKSEDPNTDPNTAIAKIMLPLFDRIYAFPLLLTTDGRGQLEDSRVSWTPLEAWRAFLRSMVLTVIATLVLTISFSINSDNDVHTTFWPGLFVNVISDYLALLVIRRRLVTLEKDNSRPQEALLFATFAGILLVTSFTGLRLIFFMLTNLFWDGHAFDTCNVCKEAADGHTWHARAVKDMWEHLRDLQLPGVLAASIVHLWLPGFAILAYLLSSLNKRLRTNLGQKHPVLALGIFAVSLAAGLAKVIRVLTAGSG